MVTYYFRPKTMLKIVSYTGTNTCSHVLMMFKTEWLLWNGHMKFKESKKESHGLFVGCCWVCHLSWPSRPRMASVQK